MTKEPVLKLNYDDSEALDEYRWSEYPEANGFVDRIYEVLFLPVLANERIGKKNLKVVLLDLYFKWKNDPSLTTEVA